MNPPLTPPREPPRDRALRWPLGLVAALLAVVAANVALVRAAVGDPSFAIEKDYHRRAVAFDRDAEARRRSAALGWEAGIVGVERGVVEGSGAGAGAGAGGGTGGGAGGGAGEGSGSGAGARAGEAEGEPGRRGEGLRVGREFGVVICDARGRPVEGATVRIEAFHNARAGEARTLEAREAGAGRYETALALDRAGIWIFRIEAVRGEARFLAEERREVGP